MRILQIVRSFSQTGGVEHVAHKLHQAWSRARIDARVLTASVARAGHRLVARYAWPKIAAQYASLLASLQQKPDVMAQPEMASAAP